MDRYTIRFTNGVSGTHTHTLEAASEHHALMEFEALAPTATVIQVVPVDGDCLVCDTPRLDHPLKSGQPVCPDGTTLDQPSAVVVPYNNDPTDWTDPAGYPDAPATDPHRRYRLHYRLAGQTGTKVWKARSAAQAVAQCGRVYPGIQIDRVTDLALEEQTAARPEQGGPVHPGPRETDYLTMARQMAASQADTYATLLLMSAPGDPWEIQQTYRVVSPSGRVIIDAYDVSISFLDVAPEGQPRQWNRVRFTATSNGAIVATAIALAELADRA